MDRHLVRLQHDLDKHDQDHPELAASVPSLPTSSYTIPHGRKSELIFVSRDELLYSDLLLRLGISGLDSDFDGEEEEEEEEEEEIEDHVIEEPVKIETDYQAMIANRNQKKKRKEAREADKDEPLYCFCQQVSYGEMVACDGEVIRELCLCV